LCGHCQIGSELVCTDGPVFSYAEIADQLGLRGF
jgi:NAD(P)H-flavin reductase